MVGNLTIQGQITGTATFDGAKISAVVTVAPPINATVNFGGGISTIEQLPDPISDSSNVYRWIRSALLTGLSAFTDVTIAATDTILQGFAKLQGQIDAVKTRLGLLESNIIFAYTTIGGEVEINATGLNIEEGTDFIISMSSITPTSNTITIIHVNDKIDIYQRGAVIIAGFTLYTYGNNFFCSARCAFLNKEMLFENSSAGQISNLTVFTQSGPTVLGRTIMANMDAITKISFKRAVAYPAGVKIQIKRI